jgi:hypothetical protein
MISIQSVFGFSTVLRGYFGVWRLDAALLKPGLTGRACAKAWRHLVNAWRHWLSSKRAGGRGAGSSSLALVKAASSRRTPKSGFKT